MAALNSPACTFVPSIRTSIESFLNARSHSDSPSVYGSHLTVSGASYMTAYHYGVVHSDNSVIVCYLLLFLFILLGYYHLQVQDMFDII